MSTKGTADDVDFEVKAFLDYVDSGIVSGDFVQEVYKVINALKTDRKAVKKFMIYEISLIASRMEGRNEDIEKIK